MKISSKGRYAVRVMAELGKNENEFLSVSYLAEKQEITVKYLEKILSILVKHNLVESQRGSQGGYRLTKKAKDITVAEILRATDDLPKLAPCLENPNFCPRLKNCDSIGCWEKLSLLINDYLGKISLDDLTKKKF